MFVITCLCVRNQHMLFVHAKAHAGFKGIHQQHRQITAAEGSQQMYLCRVPDLSSKLAPGPLPDAPVLDRPIGLGTTIDSLGGSSFARLADP